MKMFVPFLLVGAGGCAGSLMRYLMTLLFQDFYNVPFGTLISNVAGCFLIGIISGLSTDIPVLSGEARLFLATGLCGGFTTLSSLMYETGKLVEDGEYMTGTLYLGGTLSGAAIAFILGSILARFLVRGNL